MAITNASFETPYAAASYDVPGVPLGWGTALGGTSFQVAAFQSVAVTAEDFEAAWSANEGRRIVFGGAELDDPAFDAAVSEAIEDFEEEWGLVLILGLVNDLAVQYEAHRIMTAGGEHGGADIGNVITATYPATDSDEALALANDIRTQYEAHRLTLLGIHGAQDLLNAVGAPAATNWVLLVALVNEMKIDLDLHRVLTAGGVHGAADTTNDVTAADAWGTTRSAFVPAQMLSASFDLHAPEEFEDFEEEWFAGTYRTIFGLGELDDASFDAGAPEAFEDFEEEWGGNEGRRIVFGVGELDNAAFANGGGTMAMETYEVGKTIAVPAGIGIGLATPLDITQANRIVFAGAAPGTLELQARRDGFATWETWDTITTIPATVDLPAGLSEARIERTGAGGVNTCAILWPILTEL